jgi:hypothetical protein
MYSDMGPSTEESENSSDSESDGCIRDHADETADPLQGNSPEIYCIYVFLYCLPYTSFVRKVLRLI